MLTDSFLKYLRYERNYSSCTLDAYRRDLDQFEAYLRDESVFFDPKGIDADIVRGWLVSLMENGASTTSANRKLSTLKSFFRYLQKMGEVDANPLRLVTGPKNKKPLPVFVRDSEMEELLQEENFEKDLQGSRTRLILEMLYVTGMRRAELIGLRLSDVDFSLMQLKVSGKRNKQRIIPFAESLKMLIEEYLNFREEICLNGVDWLFVSDKGEQMPVSAVYKVVRERLASVTSLTKRSPHVLRHSFATSMLNNGAELTAVKELLGHESLASTSVYTHTSFEELKKMYKAHPRALKKGGSHGS